MGDKRKYPRFPMRCTGLAVSDTQVRGAEMIDMSQNGALFCCHFPAEFEARERIHLYFFDRESQTLCCIEALVVRAFEKAGQTYVAITFNDEIDSVCKVVSFLQEYEIAI